MPSLNNISIKKRLFISYATDWILVIAMVALFFGIDSIPPFHRQFSVEDKSLMHPFAVNEHVPVWLLAVKTVIL